MLHASQGQTKLIRQRTSGQHFNVGCAGRSCWLTKRAAAGAGGTTASAGSFDPAIIAALKKYGDHAKAGYVLYGQFCDNKLVPTEISGQKLHTIVSRGNKTDPGDVLGPLTGLDGYTGVVNIMGYPGRADVFTVPVPITGGLFGAAAVEKPSFLGCISQTTGGVGDPGELVIAFRGSGPLWADWETNLLGAVATDGLYGAGHGLVHRGFYNLFNGTPDDAASDISPMKIIKEILARYKDTPADELPRIITTGHSLGGAMAIVAAIYIALLLPGYRQDHADYTKRKLQTYTFAAPRIGDGELSSYLTGSLHYCAVQVKNQPDVVPYAPPEGLWDVPNTLAKLIGMLPRVVPTAEGFTPAAVTDKEGVPDFSMTDMARWQSYRELAAEIKSSDPDEQIKELEQYIAAARERLARSSEGGPGDTLSPAATDDLAQQIYYGMQLLLTVTTRWADNPTPDFGLCLIDVPQSGRWGGQNHSLEVYWANLDSCKQ